MGEYLQISLLSLLNIGLVVLIIVACFILIKIIKDEL